MPVKTSLSLLIALLLFQGQAALGQNKTPSKQTGAGNAAQQNKKNPKEHFVFILVVGSDLLQVPLDPGWAEIGRQDGDSARSITYGPPTKNDDHESIIVSQHGGLQTRIDAHTFMDMAKKGSESAAKAPAHLDWKVLRENNPKDVLYEFTLTSMPGFPDQYEIHRIVSGKEAIYNFCYHTRKINCAPAVRTHMRDLLGKMVVGDAKSLPVASPKKS